MTACECGWVGVWVCTVVLRSTSAASLWFYLMSSSKPLRFASIPIAARLEYSTERTQRTICIRVLQRSPIFMVSRIWSAQKRRQSEPNQLHRKLYFASYCLIPFISCGFISVQYLFWLRTFWYCKLLAHLFCLTKHSLVYVLHKSEITDLLSQSNYDTEILPGFKHWINIFGSNTHTRYNTCKQLIKIKNVLKVTNPITPSDYDLVQHL